MSDDVKAEEIGSYTDQELPQGWTWAVLGDIAKSIRPGFPSGAHNRDNRGVPHLRPMNITANGAIDLSDVKYVDVSEYDHLLEGDVLFNNTNSPVLVGKTSYVRKDTNWAYSNHMTVIRLNRGVADPGRTAYILHYLFVTGFFRMNCTNHVNQASINTTFLTDRVIIPLPPIAQQNRIVQKIEELLTELDAGVTTLRQVQAKLKRYRAAVLKAAVDGTLTEAWRAEHPDVEPASVLLQHILQERRSAWEQAELARFAKAGKTPPKGWQAKYKEPAKPGTVDLPSLPQGWCWATLSELGQLDRGRSRHRPRNAPHLYGGPYPFIQTGDVRHADTFIREYEQTYGEAGLEQSKLWPAGTLCITIAANIAETAILTFDSCFPDSVVGFLSVGILLSTRYVELYLRTIREQLEAYAPATAQKNINLETLSDVAIALPPLTEQDQIVAEVDRRLSVVAETEAQVEADLKRAERLSQSILKQAFAGKLVPQDPEDEPAGVLLERIRSQRRAGTGTGRPEKAVQLRLV